MSLLDAARFRLRTLLRQGDYARELDEEIRFHLSLEAMQREHAARGALSAADARDAARRRFGNLTTLTEETRQMAGLGFIDTARQDVRFALRSFRRTPAFTLVAVLTLAIGIGANTAIFSAVNALLLRPLPFPQPERLMQVSLASPARGEEAAHDDRVWSYPKFAAFRDAQQLFTSLAPYTEVQFTVRGEAGAERLRGEVTGASYLRTLGVRPAFGRDFGADEERPGAAGVVLLTHGFWQQRFNGDTAALGRTVTIDGQPQTVIGVLPPGFRGLTGRAEFLVPVMAQEPSVYEQPWSHMFYVVARLAPGVTTERAVAMVPELGRRVDAAFPHPQDADEHWGAAARPLDATRVDPLVRRSILVLLGAVTCVLLIACANVANLFLVRAAGRRREIAVRLAVGAGRRRLVRQLLTESVLLSLLGGAAGLVVASWGVRLLSVLDPSVTLRTQAHSGVGAIGFEAIRLDWMAFAFAAGLAVLTGLLFGLVPALQATRPQLAGALKNEEARRGALPRGVTSRTVLATAQIALALVLLVGSGLMLRSLAHLLAVDPGFTAERVLTVRFNADRAAGDSLPALYDEILARVAALPGVEHAALGNCPPLSGGCNGSILVRRDRPEPPNMMDAPSVGVHWTSPGWLEALQVPLVRGRAFGPEDRAGARKAVLVSETAARRLWPGEDPLGRPVSVGQGGFWEDTALVVGVVGDVRFGTIDSLPGAEVYLPYAQSPFARTMLFVRTSGDPLTLAPSVRRVLQELAPSAPVYDMRTLEARAGDALASARFGAVLLALFAVVALALATIGVYGVISYGVAQRRREIGVRMALGATRGEVLRLVVGQGAAIALVGAALGVAAALAATGVLRSLLFEVTPTDPMTFVSIAVVLVGAVLAASWLPARRAATVPPTEALRAE